MVNTVHGIIGGNRSGAMHGGAPGAVRGATHALNTGTTDGAAPGGVVAAVCGVGRADSGWRHGCGCVWHSERGHSWRRV